MRGFLTRVIQRRLQRLTFGTILGMAIVTTSAVVTSGLQDPELGEAEVAVVKAQVVLGFAECGAPDAGTTAACEKELRKALQALARARSAITGAATAADRGVTN